MKTQFVVCIANDGAEDLELRKLYRVVPDNQAATAGLMRVQDESGEDYLYPKSFFAPVEVSDDVAETLEASLE